MTITGNQNPWKAKNSKNKIYSRHKTMTGKQHFATRHHDHQPSSSTIPVDHSQHQYQPMSSIVPLRIHDLEHRKKVTINSHSHPPAGTSRPPLIHPSPHTTTTSPINTGLLKDHSPQSIQREHHSTQSTKSREPLSDIDQTNTMAPKQTRASTKAKEIQAADTPLVRRMKNIKNAKV